MKVDIRNRRNPARQEAEFVTQSQSVSLRSQVVLDGYLRPSRKINRKSAEAAGEDLFWPEQPCRKGHDYWRITRSGKCLACEHAHAVNKLVMPSSGGRKWRSAEDLRDVSAGSHESHCVSVFNPTMADLSPELRALLDARKDRT